VNGCSYTANPFICYTGGILASDKVNNAELNIGCAIMLEVKCQGHKIT